MPTDQLDIGGSLKGQVTVTPEEHPENRAARLNNENRAARIEDWKGVAVFITLLLGIVGIALLSAYEGFLDTNAAPDTKRWAQTVLSAVLASSISYVVGRKVGK